MNIFTTIPSLPLTTAYPPVSVTLPKSSLGYDTNNVYPAFPPMMTDGRSLVSSWQPESKLNDELVKQNGIQSNWQYRRYLTQNADEIRKTDFIETANDCGYMYPPSALDTKLGNTVPYTYTSFQDNSRPFGYADSDLKQLYMTREQLSARKVAPVVQGVHQQVRTWDNSSSK